ncbi:hypothetical protein DENSPDRAFT_933190 [Dentipellis sp. KUC8613]|nr:hypothetical protein DENSPDRAFT_933190 [Dentipellis sp. KUC8613]
MSCCWCRVLPPWLKAESSYSMTSYSGYSMTHMLQTSSAQERLTDPTIQFLDDSGTEYSPTRNKIPAHSYRFHQLKSEHDAIIEQRKAVEKRFHDGLITIYELKAQVDYWTDLLHAVSKEIQREMDTGPQTLEEVLQSWGYTSDEATHIAQEYHMHSSNTHASY